MEHQDQETYSDAANRYLDLAKEASEKLDGYLNSLKEFDAKVDEFEKLDPTPENLERLEYWKGVVDFTQFKLHTEYITLMTRMEQYRLFKELWDA